MKALYITQHGELDQLKYGDLDEPTVPPGQVKVSMKAAALNRLDLFVLGGMPGIEFVMPHVLGADGAGVVAETGEGVNGFRAGDRVMLDPLLSCGHCEFCLKGRDSLCIKVGIVGEHGPGTFAQTFVVPERNLEPIPDGVSFEQAAAFSLVFQTAWRMLTTRAKLKAGEDVLIHGIGSGVALAALKIAKLSGARVFVTSKSDEKLAKALALGADFAYNYRTVDIVREVLAQTRKRGVDVVVDSTGAQTWLQSLKVVRKAGRIVNCGATTGPLPQTDIRLLFWKQIDILGSTMSDRGEYREVVGLLAKGKLEPVIDQVFQLTEGRQALEYLQSGAQFGKVVLKAE